jgi:hypothetical protein
MVNDFKRRKCSMRSKICIVPSTWCRPPPALAAPALLGRRPAGGAAAGGKSALDLILRDARPWRAVCRVCCLPRPPGVRNHILDLSLISQVNTKKLTF